MDTLCLYTFWEITQYYTTGIDLNKCTAKCSIFEAGSLKCLLVYSLPRVLCYRSKGNLKNTENILVIVFAELLFIAVYKSSPSPLTNDRNF